MTTILISSLTWKCHLHSSTFTIEISLMSLGVK